MAKRRHRGAVRNEVAWRRALAEQAASGLTAREWCRRQGMSVGTFYRWRHTLAGRDAEGALPEAASSAVSFLPVHVTDDRLNQHGPLIEIMLAGGRHVRISGPVDRQMLTAVLDVLEHRPC